MTGMADREIRDDVAEVLVRYATGIDRRDWELFRSCFTDDCQADYGSIGMWRNGDEITEWMRVVHEPAGHTMHRITNVTVTPSTSGVTARSYIDALVMFADNEHGTRALGYYDDELVASDDGWKIAQRRFTMVLLQLVPEGTVLDINSTHGERQGGSE
jgi:3-phenylpropionate/cinnamic acid dioxygenase small subunit